jgi:5-deoxy-glucuronate isomerase
LYVRVSMLSDTLFRVPRGAGLQPLQQRGEHGARELSSWRLRLEPGQTASFTRDDEEAVLVLQQGSGTVTAGAETREISRSGVFVERASAVYIPPGTALSVKATAAFEAILVATPAAAGAEPAFIGPSDVTVNPRGRDNYSREVHDIFVRDPHVQRLMVGETFSPGGNWSSFPPHKHDGRDGEPNLEEVYHYRIDPQQGFGNQLLYTTDGESVTHQVRDGDAVLLPYGYHPVAAAPGYRLYYLWAMAGEQRKLALFEDPAHTWIHDAQP